MHIRISVQFIVNWDIDDYFYFKYYKIITKQLTFISLQSTSNTCQSSSVFPEVTDSTAGEGSDITSNH